MKPEIKQLSLDDVAELLLWAKAEGWNPGLDDAEPFQAADPSGFLGCFVDGRMAAGISAVTSGPDFGFIGLYICHPDFRGQGLGKRVWDAGMDHLGNRTIGLDGVPAQQENYRRKGFAPAYRTWRFSGTFTPIHVDHPVSIVTGTNTEIATFDRNFYPGIRREFLARWLGAPRITRTIRHEGELQGYGVLRKCHHGYKIGPLFAARVEDVGHIFDALCAETNGEVVSIDVPETASTFSDTLAALGFERSFDTMRMYRGQVPDIDMSGIFGVTTLELG
ncbi:MAG: family acetyltransferase [Rhizobium sp.]|nr:family acetyltransferase [Rhizobium sp.]